MKLGILFPGQGSQKVGMGLDIYEQSNHCRDLFNYIDKITGRNISNIFLYGPSDQLNQTKNTQISIVAISVGLTQILKDELKNRNITFAPQGCAGHSLGEFTALWFANIIEIEELINIISIRSNLMQNAPPGGMAAILNLSDEEINKIINENNIVIANYNSPTQFVISGDKETLHEILEKIKLAGGKSIILPVSGAFHSPLMNDVSKSFILELSKLSILSKNKPTIPIYQNYDGKPSSDLNTINEKMQKQMTSPVFWTQTINNLVKDGVTAVLEIGPGKVLTGLVKKINPEIDCYNIFDLASLKEFITNYECKLSPTKS